MNTLLTITALTLLTSTAWANNDKGTSYTGEGSDFNIEHSHLIPRTHIIESIYVGEGPQLISKRIHQSHRGSTNELNNGRQRGK